MFVVAQPDLLWYNRFKLPDTQKAYLFVKAVVIPEEVLNFLGKFQTGENFHVALPYLYFRLC